jgi:NADH:ubiquinone oxidoreductase subunit D
VEWRQTFPAGWLDWTQKIHPRFPDTIYEIDRMLTKNAIWVGRTVGLGVMTPTKQSTGVCRSNAARIGSRL